MTKTELFEAMDEWAASKMINFPAGVAVINGSCGISVGPQGPNVILGFGPGASLQGDDGGNPSFRLSADDGVLHCRDFQTDLVVPESLPEE